MRLMELQGVRVLCSGLMIGIAPLSSAAVGSFYGPGFYLPVGQTTVANAPRPVTHRPLPVPKIGYWPTSGSAPTRDAYPWVQPTDFKGYRYKPLQSMQGHKSHFRSDALEQHMAGLRADPVKHRQLSFPRAKRGSTVKPNWRMLEGYRTAPYSSWEFRKYGNRGAWKERIDFNRYKFRPVSGTNPGVMVGMRRDFSRIPPRAQYRYRPIDAKSQPVLTWYDWSRVCGSYASNEFPNYRQSLEPAYAIDATRALSSWQGSSHRQFTAPISRDYPRRYMDLPDAHESRHVGVHFTIAPGEGFPEYRFRPVDQNSQSLNHPRLSPSRDYPFSHYGMMLSSDLRPNNGGLYRIHNGYRQPAAVQTSVVADWNDGRGGAYASLHSAYWPLVSQYDFDERMMIDYENNKF